MFLNKEKVFTIFYFGFYLLIGLFIYKDYGIPYDDYDGRENGAINAKYIAKSLFPRFLKESKVCLTCPDLINYKDADHGPVFEIIPTIFEYLFHLEDLQDIYFLRHLCVFILFFISSIFFYFLLQKRFQQYLLSFAGVTMLILSPRIFADSFFNAKDLPFLSFTIISMFTLFNFLNKRTILNICFHALACSLAISTRILGIILPILTILTLIVVTFNKQNFNSKKRVINYLITFCVLSFLFTILFWPYLWEAPISRFISIWNRALKYPWLGEVLFEGKIIKATNLPWYYLPKWILITTPQLYSALFIIGIFFLFHKLIIKGRGYFVHPKYIQDSIIVILFFGPVVGAIMFKLILYDGWRHFFFVYPAFIYISTIGLDFILTSVSNVKPLWEKVNLKLLVITFWVTANCNTLIWLVNNHPHQNVYFNFNKKVNIREKYELDYWGLSYKQALEHLILKDNNSKIYLKVNNYPGVLNSYTIPENLRNRLYYVKNIKDANYFITEYRLHPTDYPFINEIFTIKIDDVKIISIYKLK